jgi:hypothetical protein
MTDQAGEVEFPLSTATITNYYGGTSYVYSSTIPLIYAIDDSGNTRTKFIATQPCNVTVNWQESIAVATNQTQVYKNGTLISIGTELNTTNYASVVGTSIYLNTGDYITVGSTGTGSSTATINYLSIVAIPAYATMMAAVPPDLYQEVVYSGATTVGSTNTQIPYFPTLLSTISNATLGTMTSTAAGGTYMTVGPSCTALKRCFVSGVYNFNITSTPGGGITKNATNYTDNTYTLEAAHPEQIICHESATNGADRHCAFSRVPVISGDIIAPRMDGGTSQLSNLRFTIEQSGY